MNKKVDFMLEMTIITVLIGPFLILIFFISFPNLPILPHTTVKEIWPNNFNSTFGTFNTKLISVLYGVFIVIEVIVVVFSTVAAHFTYLAVVAIAPIIYGDSKKNSNFVKNLNN